jgi:error-prone DNA polymerase
VNFSAWNNTLERTDEGRLALRIGFRQVEGLKEAMFPGPHFGPLLSEGRGVHGAPVEARFSTLAEVTLAGVSVAALRILADADCFRSIGLDRRRALWEIRRMPQSSVLPLFAAADARELAEEPDARLPEMPIGEHVATDYQTMRLSLKAHPMAILRPVFVRERINSCVATSALRDGQWSRTAGVVLVRQRPGKGNAIFVTLEDETGVSNVVIWASKFESYRRAIMAARLMLVEGRVQKSPEGVIHLMAERIIDRSSELAQLFDAGDPVFSSGTVPAAHRGHPRDARVMPKSRDFH